MLQRWIVELLRPLLQWWLTQRGVKAFVGADQFIYWHQHDPHARVSPDVYLLPGVDPHTRVRTWKIWQDRVVPSFAFEVVSQDWEKDYTEVPARYAALGVAEVVIFDPGYTEHPEGVRWQVLRRVGKRGLVRVEAKRADRVRSRALGCWLRVVGEGRDTRVRLAVSARGDELVPTAEEREEAERGAVRSAQPFAVPPNNRPTQSQRGLTPGNPTRQLPASSLTLLRARKCTQRRGPAGSWPVPAVRRAMPATLRESPRRRHQVPSSVAISGYGRPRAADSLLHPR